MKMRKIFFLVPVVAMLFLVGCTKAPLTDSGNVLALESLTYDWGEISIDGGDVEHGFWFKNDGEEELVLYGAVTSCMCTIAKFELGDGSLSPEFGMHENKEWSYVVAPGEKFELEVEFDPMAHGADAVGPINRTISMFTSASEVPFLLNVTADVLYNSEYEAKYGDSPFVFEEKEYDFGVVKQSQGIISYDFEFTYMGEEKISVTGVPTSCACTGAEISQNEFKKGDKGVLTVNFDPNLHEEPVGKFFKTVSILTEPKLEKQPEVKIWAEMDLDLGEEAYKLKQHND